MGSSDNSSAGKGTAHGDRVGEFEITAVRHTAGNARRDHTE
jgi:hypothetical protein